MTPDSPTQRVGGKPQEQFRVVQHIAPMLSLDATREGEEVRPFDERVRKTLRRAARYLLEEKFDGASIELVYENGVFNRAVTRGDGRVSSQTDYVVVGSKPGRKWEEAKAKGVEILSENQFVDLFRKLGADALACGSRKLSHSQVVCVKGWQISTSDSPLFI